MDGGGRELVGLQEALQHVGHALGLDEDERQAGAARLRFRLAVEDVQQHRALVVIFNVFDLERVSASRSRIRTTQTNLLSNVFRCRADTTNDQVNVVAKEVASKHLDVAREGG